MSNMERLEALAKTLPESVRVDVEAWGDHPTFRVRGKNFVFCDDRATQLSLKLSHEEAAAVVATESWVRAASYGLGRHGWVLATVEDPAGEDRWQQVEEWVKTSYSLVAPKALAHLVVPGGEGSSGRPAPRGERRRHR
ncbi:MAG TPA: MmcQ/YjbR family DNA-binding protein [Acidimicrobiales bacterium]|jgi:predicted DNA-binding protein (MmcQ/YjbR family)|nr:MmcQ/YjbR family DNA-binding protein [Acidimicrobiales bacterium]